MQILYILITTTIIFVIFRQRRKYDAAAMLRSFTYLLVYMILAVAVYTFASGTIYRIWARIGITAYYAVFTWITVRMLTKRQG